MISAARHEYSWREKSAARGACPPPPKAGKSGGKARRDGESLKKGSNFVSELRPNFSVMFFGIFNMNIEYEATFPNINKDEIRRRLAGAGAVLIKNEFLQRRTVFQLPKGNQIDGGWLRVRDEGDKITMSLKVVNGDKITDQKEICLKVDDYNEAVIFLENIGCQQKSYQENRREIWRLGKAEVTIDEWPFLEPFVEIEADSENSVQAAAKTLGFDYSKAIFGATDLLYEKRYGLSLEIINNHTPRIVFAEPNPFLGK